MKSYRRWMLGSLLLALMATGVVVSAQDKQSDKAAKADKERHDVLVQRGVGFSFDYQEAAGGPGDRVWFRGDDSNHVFVASEMMSGHAVKGAPYSAQAVTESTQTLADGNRIVRRTTASVYRDSEGRTRRDQTIGDVAPYATAVGEPSQIIMINDPVGGAHYMLDPRSKTARKMSFLVSTNKVEGKTVTTVQTAPMILTPEQAAEGAVKANIEVHVAQGEHIPLPAKVGGEPGTFNFKIREPKHEDLGKQTIDGVEVEGQRETITIPAGEIGNEQPIQIISESWYSPELQVTVMTRHSDPRMGETVYKLTNINRAEPAHSLFEVPSDYTIKETVEPKMKMMLDHELQRARKPEKQDN
jgi:hypothetical protein